MFNKDKIKEKYQSAIAKSITPDSQASNSKLHLVQGGTSMIGPSVKIEGKITSDESLLIEGQVDGSIVAESSEVVVGKSGVLTANISAKVVKIEGKVKGDIAGGENVVIAKTGNVLGNIESPRVTLEDGAKFKGSIEMDPGDKAIKELPLSTPSNVKARGSAPDSDAKAS